MTEPDLDRLWYWGNGGRPAYPRLSDEELRVELATLRGFNTTADRSRVAVIEEILIHRAARRAALVAEEEVQA